MWIYQDEILTEVPEGCVGFVYEIRRIRDGKKYIGKKAFFSTVTKAATKTNPKKRKVVKESDWRKYYGSNAELMADLKVDGPDGFRREIIHLCPTKSDMTYWETYEIMVRHCIRRDDYYNAWLSATIRKGRLA